MNSYYLTVVLLFVTISLYSNVVQGKPFQQLGNNGGKRLPRSIATLASYNNQLPTIDPIKAIEQEYFEEARHGRQSSYGESEKEYLGPPPTQVENTRNTPTSADANSYQQSSTGQPLKEDNESVSSTGNDGGYNNPTSQQQCNSNGSPDGLGSCKQSSQAEQGLSYSGSESGSSHGNNGGQNTYVYTYQPVEETNVNTGYHSINYVEEKNVDKQHEIGSAYPEFHSIPLYPLKSQYLPVHKEIIHRTPPKFHQNYNGESNHHSYIAKINHLNINNGGNNNHKYPTENNKHKKGGQLVKHDRPSKTHNIRKSLNKPGKHESKKNKGHSQGIHKFPIQGIQKSAIQGIHKSSIKGIHKATIQGIQKSSNPEIHKSSNSNPGSHKSSNPGIHKSSTQGIHKSSNPGIHKSSNSNPGSHKSSNPGIHKSSTQGIHKSSNPGIHKSSNANPGIHKSFNSNPGIHKSSAQGTHTLSNKLNSQKIHQGTESSSIPSNPSHAITKFKRKQPSTEFLTQNSPQKQFSTASSKLIKSISKKPGSMSIKLQKSQGSKRSSSSNQGIKKVSATNPQKNNFGKKANEKRKQ